MNNNTSLPDNPYVSLQNEVVAIHCNRKEFKLPVGTIRKIYLSKWKSERWTSLISQMFTAPGNLYTLHIQTQDNTEIDLKITSLERYYFIRLIYLIRHSRDRNKVSRHYPTAIKLPLVKN